MTSTPAAGCDPIVTRPETVACPKTEILIRIHKRRIAERLNTFLMAAPPSAYVFSTNNTKISRQGVELNAKAAKEAKD